MSNIVIVGSGPAGVSAALYAVRAGVQTTVLTKGSGALARAEKIENYYGFAEPVTAAIISTLVLGSPFTLWDALGFGCIFLMLVLLFISNEKQAKSAASA